MHSSVQICSMDDSCSMGVRDPGVPNTHYLQVISRPLPCARLPYSKHECGIASNGVPADFQQVGHCSYRFAFHIAQAPGTATAASHCTVPHTTHERGNPLKALCVKDWNRFLPSKLAVVCG